MGFEQTAVPRGRLCADRKSRVCRSIRAEKGAVPSMEVHRSDVDFLDVPLANQARAVEALIADTVPVITLPALGILEIRRRLSEVSKSADALQSEASNLEGLAGGEVPIVAATRVGCAPLFKVKLGFPSFELSKDADYAVSGRPSSGPSTPDSNLVVTDAEMCILPRSVLSLDSRGQGLKVIVRIRPRHVRERQNALFGEQVIQLELTHFDVEPTAAEKIVQARPNRFEVEGSRIVRGRQHVERYVFCQCATGVKVQAAPIEPIRCDFGFNVIRATYSVVHSNAICALSMPERRDAERHRPIAGVLVDGGIPVVAHLIAVVFECLPEGTEHRPAEVARGTRHPIFTRECRERANLGSRERQGVGRRAIREDQSQEDKTEKKTGYQPRQWILYDPLESVRTYRLLCTGIIRFNGE